MSSDQEPAAKKKTKHSKLCMDSDDELRAEQSEEERRQRRQEKIQRRKEKEIERERRQREREQRERQREQEEDEEEQELDYNILLLQDSNSHTCKKLHNSAFTKTRQNIRETYPSKKDHWEEKPVEKKPKKDRQPKVKKPADNDSDLQEPAAKAKAAPVKPQGKDQLVYEFAKRWWYVLPAEWPPKDYDYTAHLEKEGYRLVPQQSFRKQPNTLSGLTKAHEVDGFRGIFKSPNKLIDVRPKDTCPSIENFRKLSSTQLTEKTRLALERQIDALQRVQHKQNGDQDLLRELNTLLLKYNH